MLELAVIAFSLVFVLSSLNAIRTTRSVQVFEELQPPASAYLPKVSVIVTACNEEETIGAALTTLASQSYPDLEVIVVNDRSQDRTGEIIDALASVHDKLVPIHIEALPAGWLGKVHALHQGATAASGEWLLFTDADVHFAPDVLQKAVAYVTWRMRDHFAVLPRVPPQKSFWLNVAIAAFGGLFLQQMRIANVESSDSRAFVGSGGFNLVRRSALEQTPGFAWLKMEVADDLGLGLMLKRHGFSSTFAVSRGDISVAWYRTLGEMARGLEKNSFLTMANGSVTRLLVLTGFLIAYVPAPVVAIVAMDNPYVVGLGTVALGAFAAAVVASERRFHVGLAAALLMPVGLLLLAGITIRASFKCLRRGGIYWRGTFYSLAELKAGRRVRL